MSDDEQYELFDSLEGARGKFDSDSDRSPLSGGSAQANSSAAQQGGSRRLRPKPLPLTNISSRIVSTEPEPDTPFSKLQRHLSGEYEDSLEEENEAETTAAQEDAAGGDASSTALPDSSIEVSDYQSAMERIEELEISLEKAYHELSRERAEGDRLRSRLKHILWDYLPKQRNVTDIPPVDSKALFFDANSDIKFRDYNVISFVGRGHFGKVYCGVHKTTNERVAIKVMELVEQLRLEDVLAIEQEIRAIKVLTHPNCVRLVQLIHAKEHICIVMNYVSGGNLHDYIACHHPIPKRDIQKVFSGIMAAVAYMHQRGFSHRDLKPENVLIDSELEPCVIDFGLCTKTNPGASIKSVCGTNGFMAPELNGTKPFNPQPADVWSAGCTLAECAFGKNAIGPLEDIGPATAAVTLRRFFSGLRSEEGATDRTEAALDFMEKTLCEDPKKRLVAAKAVEHPIARRDGGAPSSGGSPEGRKSLRRAQSMRSMGTSPNSSITSPTEFRRLNALHMDSDLDAAKLPGTPPSNGGDDSTARANRRLLMSPKYALAGGSPKNAGMGQQRGSPKNAGMGQREFFGSPSGSGGGSPKMLSSQSAVSFADLKAHYGGLPDIS